jgi:hypothetical protein
VVVVLDRRRLLKELSIQVVAVAVAELVRKLMAQQAAPVS